MFLGLKYSWILGHETVFTGPTLPLFRLRIGQSNIDCAWNQHGYSRAKI